MADTKGEGIDSYIDSQAAIQAIFSDTVNSKTVLAAIEAANKLGEENYITINWVKAHNGYSLNEIADELAKTGAEANGPQRKIEITDAQIKSIIDTDTEKAWNREWVNCEGHRQTKLFFPKVNKAKAIALYNNSKSVYSQLVRWITGFNGLSYHNNKINPAEYPDPTCHICEEGVDETSAHLMASQAVVGLHHLKSSLGIVRQSGVDLGEVHDFLPPKLLDD